MSIRSLPLSLIHVSRQVLLETSQHPMIEVDGAMRHRNNSEGQPIHPTDEGIRSFYRWFGDSDSLDQHGRPQVFYHGTPVYGSHREQSEVLPFREFSKTNSGLFSFSGNRKFARDYAISKSHESYSNDDSAPFVFATYLKTKTFDPANKQHLEDIKPHLGDTVTHGEKYGMGSFGKDIAFPVDTFLERLHGIGDAQRPITKDEFDKVTPGSHIRLDGGDVYIHHKSNDRLFYTPSYELHNLPPEHIQEITAAAKTEPEKSTTTEFKIFRKDHLGIPMGIDRKTVSLRHATWVPTKVKIDNWNYTENDAFRAAASKLGYNAVKQTEKSNVNLAVFSPNQIKSATHNNGEFSRKSTNITE